MSSQETYKTISGVLFGLLDPDTIRKMSVERIITPDTYDADGTPVTSGLMDGLLGTIDPGQRCKTCGARVGSCPGHFGHIELSRPVIHVGYNKVIYKVLRATCRSCHRVLLDPAEIEEISIKMKDYEDQWGVPDYDLVEEILKKAAKKNVCPYCSEEQHKIRLEKPTTYFEEVETETGQKQTNKLSPLDIHSWFKEITAEDCLLLGINPSFARPEWMILWVLPVPPVSVRPSITLENGIRSEDDLTHKLVDIIRINQRLLENREAGAPQLIVEDLWELLQYHVSTYFDNEISGIPPARHRSGRALRTLTQRLKGKEGRFRANLSGKRVDFSARTVISPDPLLSINEVGVPKDIAEILTVPERVTEWNIEEMKELVMQGPRAFPGVNYIIRPDGRRVDLRYARNLQAVADSLQPSFIIERHLRDGDVVLFNRQPSLHRMSIMAHEVKVVPYKTFRLTLPVCLEGSTPIITSLGQIPISRLVNGFEDKELLSATWSDEKSLPIESKQTWQNVLESQIVTMGDKGDRHLLESYRIITQTGRTIEGTADHPLYSDRGKLPLSEIKSTDRLAALPIEYPYFESPKGKVILTPDDIIAAMPESTKKRLSSTLNKLKQLMNIQAGSKEQIVLARLLGYLFADGHLSVSKRKIDSNGNIKYKTPRVQFTAGSKKDILAIKKDLMSLKIDHIPEPHTLLAGSEITKSSGVKYKARGKAYYLDIKSQPFSVAFKAIGMPEGRKTRISYRVPVWIREGTSMVKRAFLRGYFGGDLSKPQLHGKSGKVFGVPRLKIAKVEGVSHHELLNDIQIMLTEFEIEIAGVSERSGNLLKDGKSSIIYILSIASNDDNLLKFYKKLGYAYAYKKELLARHVSGYLEYKIALKLESSKWLETLNEEFNQHNLSSGEGMALKILGKKHGHPPSKIKGFLNKKKTHFKNPEAFPSFNQWRDEATKNLSDGFIWEEVAEIESIGLDVAYDVSMEGHYPNFVANGFLSGNCRPYNADFDGDEMNLHVPQSEEAQAEARILMRVQEQISTPRYGGPIIGAIQDFITSAYFLTRRGSMYNKSEASQLITAAGLESLPKADLKGEKGEPLWSGKLLFSALLPDTFNFTMFNNLCEKHETCKKVACPTEGYILIRDGVLVSGIIDKKAFGAEVPDSVLHRILKEYGANTTKNFLDSVTRMLITNITLRGFSMGASDIDIPPEADKKIREVLEKAKKDVKKVIEQYENGTLDRQAGRTEEETLEARIMEILASARTSSSDIGAKYLDSDNEALIMAKTGARGNMLNLGQMSACVGQQAVRGQRIQRGYRNRVLPFFKPGDLSAEAHGFVDSSFRSGLNPIEFFMHAAGGREGLVDTAVRTSQSGYMQRRLVNALQDISSCYDKTVRNAAGEIVQFLYGDDNIDPAKSDHGKAVNVSIIVNKILETHPEVEGPEEEED